MAVIQKMNQKSYNYYHQHWKLCNTILMAFGVSLLRKVYCVIHRKYSRYPPGPDGFPFIGCFLSTGNIPEFASYLASSYGAISMIYIGNQPFIFLHSIKYINEILNNENALDRDWDNSLLYTYLKPNEIHTALVSQKYWKRKREIFQSILISRLNSRFVNVVHNKSMLYVFNAIDECIKNNKLWLLKDSMNYIQFHLMWNAVFNTFISFNNKHRKHMTELILKTLNDAGNDVVVRYLGLKNILPSKYLNSIFPNSEKLQNFIETQIYEQLKYDETVFDMNNKKWNKQFEDINNVQNNHCVASKLLYIHRKNPSQTYGSKQAILSEIHIFFVAGFYTSYTAEYGVILLAKNEKVQEQIYNELRSHLGMDWQISSVAPLGAAHYNSKCNIWLKNGKYQIPKNSVIITDIPTANRNDKYWIDKTNGNSMDLCLNMWLDKNNNFRYNLNKDKMMTFSVGPRQCAGNTMALRSLYLLFVKLILNYKFGLQTTDKNIKIQQEYQFAFTIKPEIGVLIKKRN
eukprot:232478_1